MTKKKSIIKISFLLFLFLIIYSISFADIITYPHNEWSSALSTELILSYEHVLSKRTTGLIWLGGGFIQALKKDRSFLFGLEAALAFRYYFKPYKYDKFFLGIYGGGCIMYNIRRHPDDHYGYPWGGVTFGIKLGYKVVPKDSSNKRFVIEPYISIAISLLKQVGQEFQKIGDFSYPLATIGVRFVYEWIPQKK